VVRYGLPSCGAKGEIMIQKQIRDFLVQNILFTSDGFDYGDDDSFLEQGIIDSVGIMELILFVEETYCLRVEEHEVTPDNFDSVNKLARYIKSKQNGNSIPNTKEFYPPFIS
jgi:acyl carrier protein